ncbi:Fibronectin type III [Trinorchestia longiramus]|nr:Fibronectin type III [Trinorchestia longiramus]
MNVSHTKATTFARPTYLLSSTFEFELRWLNQEYNNNNNNVDYLFAAPPQFQIQYQNQTAQRGTDAVLECEAEGETPIGIVWKKDGQNVEPDQEARFGTPGLEKGELAVDSDQEGRYTVREEPRNSGVHSSLSIKKTDRPDSASYTCLATNPFGSADTNINLIVQEIPEQPSGLKVLDKTGRSVELTWIPPYDGNSPITRYIVEYKQSRQNWEDQSERLMVSDSNIAAVLDLRPATTYHFRIIAKNEIGNSEPSHTVTIITAEEAPSGPPRDVRAEYVDQHSIKIMWKPPRNEEWNGVIQGYQVGYRLASTNRSFVYESVEFSMEGAREHHLVIGDLDVYTEYAVVVSAFNKVGPGPKSPEVRAYTKEGKPQQPPQDVTCTTLTSQTIRVVWSSPPLDTVQGVIQGYRVFYAPSDTWYDETTIVAKNTQGTDTHLHGLDKYTNYTLQVLAYTNGGDGVKSSPTHCHTDQDIPEAPTSVKALVTSAESILVSWLSPERPNGVITQYTVYFKQHGTADEEVRTVYFKQHGTADEEVRTVYFEQHGTADEEARTVFCNSTATVHRLSPTQLTFEAKNLDRQHAYVFWVTASTLVGEGDKSQSVHLKPSDKVPAKIASFEDEYIATFKEDVILACKAVGIPKPDVMWSVQGKPFKETDRIRMQSEGSLLIREVSRGDGGEYTCMVENAYGKDTVTHTLLIQAPPHAPEIEILSTTTDKIQVKLKPSTVDDTAPIHGYTLHYKPEFSDWETVQVPAAARTYTLENLWCGSRYQIYAAAYNKIGTGEPSEVLSKRTRGTMPVVPDVLRFVEVSSTSVSLHLNAWGDGGCPINYFVVEYKPKHASEWTIASNQVKPRGNYAIMELTSATRYNLRVSAHNNAGLAVAEYECATLTVSGGTIAPAREIPAYGSGHLPLYLNLNLILPIVSAIVVIVLAIVIICYLKGRSVPIKEEVYQQYQYNASMVPPSTMDKRPPGAFAGELGYIPPPNRKLPPVPGTNFNTCDRIKRAPSSVGTASCRSFHTTWDPRRKHTYEQLNMSQPNRHLAADGLYSGPDDEICPYATFHLLGFREEANGAPGAAEGASSNFQTFPHPSNGGTCATAAAQTMPRPQPQQQQEETYYSCVAGDYTCGHSSHGGNTHQVI